MRSDTTLDFEIAGRDVDVKFSAGTAWMIPPEALGHPCILISADDVLGQYSLGFFLARDEYLTTAPNRDKKRGVSQRGRTNIKWLFRNTAYPKNFWQTVPHELAVKIASGRSGNERVVTLFREITNRPITRKVVEDVASQRDFMRRLRADATRGTRNILAREGILVLCGNWKKSREFIRRVGLHELAAGEFMSHRLRSDEVEIAKRLGCLKV